MLVRKTDERGEKYRGTAYKYGWVSLILMIVVRGFLVDFEINKFRMTAGFIIISAIIAHNYMLDSDAWFERELYDMRRGMDTFSGYLYIAFFMRIIPVYHR